MKTPPAAGEKLNGVLEEDVCSPCICLSLQCVFMGEVVGGGGCFSRRPYDNK